MPPIVSMIIPPVPSRRCRSCCRRCRSPMPRAPGHSADVPTITPPVPAGRGLSPPPCPCDGGSEPCELHPVPNSSSVNPIHVQLAALRMASLQSTGPHTSKNDTLIRAGFRAAYGPAPSGPRAICDSRCRGSVAPGRAYFSAASLSTLLCCLRCLPRFAGRRRDVVVAGGGRGRLRAFAGGHLLEVLVAGSRLGGRSLAAAGRALGGGLLAALLRRPRRCPSPASSAPASRAPSSRTRAPCSPSIPW